MTRKDYIAIAGAINRALLKWGDYNEATIALRGVADDIALYAKNESYLFDRDKFFAACNKEATNKL